MTIVDLEGEPEDIRSAVNKILPSGALELVLPPFACTPELRERLGSISNAAEVSLDLCEEEVQIQSSRLQRDGTPFPPLSTGGQEEEAEGQGDPAEGDGVCAEDSKSRVLRVSGGHQECLNALSLLISRAKSAFEKPSSSSPSSLGPPGDRKERESEEEKGKKETGVGKKEEEEGAPTLTLPRDEKEGIGDLSPSLAPMWGGLENFISSGLPSPTLLGTSCVLPTTVEEEGRGAMGGSEKDKARQRQWGPDEKENRAKDKRETEEENHKEEHGESKAKSPHHLSSCDEVKEKDIGLPSAHILSPSVGLSASTAAARPPLSSFSAVSSPHVDFAPAPPVVEDGEGDGNAAFVLSGIGVGGGGTSWEWTGSGTGTGGVGSPPLPLSPHTLLEQSELNGGGRPFAQLSAESADTALHSQGPYGALLRGASPETLPPDGSGWGRSYDTAPDTHLRTARLDRDRESLPVQQSSGGTSVRVPPPPPPPPPPPCSDVILVLRSRSFSSPLRGASPRLLPSLFLGPPSSAEVVKQHQLEWATVRGIPPPPETQQTPMGSRARGGESQTSSCVWGALNRNWETPLPFLSPTQTILSSSSSSPAISTV
uniref:Uncharacterized protein n=1 Tax=Chromera velia CCMP2878 TaxID=1169474 RepID=A0A0G4I4V3_9ALVE|eukprot:Cvel_1813.t1-p1 / transcript=Cvel_1813.t1 / gene=Cvel_1813 / organism=Chromera_velia_CCMP2878 / gene_product=hypothetical protein / transcript_product=hypothetical protein / location=Cvel_scaffold67:7202-9237(+) / protein_length=597 / sequence_SO=supercontig / SO=protein_coding / is_pseudo=false